MRYFSIVVLLSISGLLHSQPVFQFPVTLPPELKAYAGNDLTILAGNTTMLGSIPSATGGYGNYTYNWQPSATLDDSSLPNPTASPLVTTTYTLNVTDDENCTASASITVTVDTSSYINNRIQNKAVLVQNGDVFTLFNVNCNDCKIEITNISGASVGVFKEENTNNGISFRIPGSPGIYVITMQGSHFVYQTKCVKL